MAYSSDGTSGEPKLKKYKTDQESLFDKYWEDPNAVERLRKTLELLTTREYCFCLLKILKCNADKGVTFQQAYCETTNNSKETSVGAKSIEAFRFSTVFKSGYTMVRDYCSDESKVPAGRVERIAVERLLKVLMSLKDTEEALKTAQSTSEVNWTITLTHHLLRNLAVNKTYVVDKHNSGRSHCCVCCKQQITGTFGDTSIGCTAVWHGYVDVILGSDVPIVAVEGDSEDEEICDGNKTSFKIKQSVDFPARHRDKLIAQSIVFSFLQKKEKSAYEPDLVPSIGICKTQAVLFLYDSENDVLLESNVLQLMTPSGHIITSAVLALWLAINFSVTCSRVAEPMKSLGFTADFPKHVGKELQVYEEKLRFGCGAGHEVKEKFEPKVYDILNLQ